VNQDRDGGLLSSCRGDADLWVGVAKRIAKVVSLAVSRGGFDSPAAAPGARSAVDDELRAGRLSSCGGAA